MDKLFQAVLNMSVTGAFVIAVIILARIPLKKAPKTISYCLWAVAGFRLVCPFTLEGVFSLIPRDLPEITAPVRQYYVTRPPVGTHERIDFMLAAHPAGTPIWTVYDALAIVWLAGIAAMSVYGAVSIVLLRRGLRGAALAEDGAYEVETLKTPFVIGLFRPRIYIPSGLTGEERRYIVLHERTHIRRGDHIVKMFSWFVLCLHWFNPLVWAAFLLMGTDMEMSCDERVMKELGGNIKHDYSLSLVRMAAGRRILNGSPPAFGEGGVKERVKNILNFKKPSRIIIVAAVALAAALMVGLAVNGGASNVRSITLKLVGTEDGWRVGDVNVGAFELSQRPEIAPDESGVAFTTTDTELPDIGAFAVDIYLKSLTAEKIPITERISGYTINDVSVMGGDINEFAVAVNYDFTTDSDEYVNPAAGARGKGTWPDNYTELRIKKFDGYFKVVGVGTGGGAQGLFATSEVFAPTWAPLKDLPLDYGKDAAIADGIYVNIHGSEIYNQKMIDMFYESVFSEKQAMIRTMEYTVEGDPIITDYWFDGDSFTVTADSRRDKFGAQEIFAREYLYLVPLDRSRPAGTLKPFFLSNEQNIYTSTGDGGVTLIDDLTPIPSPSDSVAMP
jgi:beta-lactamase regulating signal transducer with metallopeptidase domain